MNICSENVTYLLGRYLPPKLGKIFYWLVGGTAGLPPNYAKPWLGLSGLGIRAKVGTWDAASLVCIIGKR